MFNIVRLKRLTIPGKSALVAAAICYFLLCPLIIVTFSKPPELGLLSVLVLVIPVAFIGLVLVTRLLKR